MRIAEVFRSVQGEGFLTGTESIFVRTSGCNLRCCYCDTPYASWSPEGKELSVAEIATQIEALAQPASQTSGPISHVVLSGGEPMLFAELIALCERLRLAGKHLTVETAGTLYLPVVCDLMSISPKLSNSTPPPEKNPRWAWHHETSRHVPAVIRRLVAEYEYQLKFVVDRLDDCREVEDYLAEFPEIDRDRAMLMPQGTDAADLARKAEWLEPYCAAHNLKFCPRRQIEWFGHQRGK
jgi:7-carboxy-7-deazaguanine synthase